MRSTNLLLVSVFVLVLVSSCSQKSNPVLPEDYQDGPSSDQILISDSAESMQNNPYRGVLGAWKVVVDTESMTAEIIPARSGKAIGDIFDADLYQFLTVSPCANCLMISNIRQAEADKLHLDVKMKHPFGNIASRPDLHGFDVRAIFIGPSVVKSEPNIQVTLPDGTTEDAKYNPSFLLNAEGLTQHFDGLINDERYFIHAENYGGNLNPYLRFFEDRTTPVFDPHAPAGYNVMPVGAGNYTRTAVFEFGHGSTLEFYLVADVAYGHSAVYQTRPNPEYYLPSYNRTEPWRVEYWIENNTLAFNNSGSTADVVVQVFDWQHNATVDPNYPDPANLSGVRESSQVAQVELLVTDLQDAPIISTTPESGTGTPTDPLQYRFTVTAENFIFGDEAIGLIAVRDELHGQASPSGRMPIPEQPAGFPYDTEDIRDYSYYGLVYINIPVSFSSMSHPYDNEIQVEPGSQYADSDTQIDATFFMDQSHKMFQYKWDYDYDGVTFDVDGDGLPSPVINYPTGGKKNTGLRVRTNSKPAKEYIYTIPVYSEGEEFKSNVDDTNTWIATSRRTSNSVGMSADNFYIAYSVYTATRRKIQLAVGDRDGNFTYHWVDDSDAYDSTDPAIVIVEDGINDGVYIAYTSNELSGGNTYFNHGNLDGTGFESANIVKITSSLTKSLLQPCLAYRNGDFLVCYVYIAGMSRHIYFTRSIDLGVTWPLGTSVDGVATIQQNPTVVSTSLGYYVVWQDSRNWLERGYDLYMAESSDGSSFDPSRNISASFGNIHETEPSLAASAYHLLVAHLSQVDGSTVRDVHLKALDLYNPTIINFPLFDRGTGAYKCAPSVGVGARGRATVAYSAYNAGTTDLTFHAVQVVQGFEMGRWGEWPILEESIGQMADVPGASIFPAVAVRQSLGGYATENFIVWKDYTAGSFKELGPYTEYFGDVNAMSYVSDGDWN